MAKQQRLEEIEKKLYEYSSKSILNQDVIDLANEAAILSRDLEESEDTVVGKFERAIRLSRKKGNQKSEKENLYSLAWYYHWWLNDSANFEKWYIEFEAKVLETKSIEETNTDHFNMTYTFDGIDTYIISLDSIYLYDATIDNHKVITDSLYKLLANVLAVSFIYKDFEKTMEKMFVDDKTFERVLNHTNCLYNLNKIFGNGEDEDYIHHDIKRMNEWYADAEISYPNVETENPFDNVEKIIYGKPGDELPENKCFENISHNNIYSSGIIKCNHWDVACWKGVMYLGDLERKEFIRIGFLFENEIGARKVFQDLIDNVSKNDTNGKIIISFIKGINKDRIYDYRVMITGKVDVPKNNKDNIIISSLARFHEMNCVNDNNIHILEQIVNKGNNPSIYIFPAIVGSDRKIKPLYDLEIMISTVSIKQAYEIGKSDVEASAILKDDKPIIPRGMANAPINELLELKKSSKYFSN